MLSVYVQASDTWQRGRCLPLPSVLGGFPGNFGAPRGRQPGGPRAPRPPPPREPSSAAADFAESISSASSPVAMRMTLTDMPITSAGRFSPRGPRGIYNRPHRFGFPVLALLLPAFWMRSGFLVGV